MCITRRSFIDECDYGTINKAIENSKVVGQTNNGVKVFWYSVFICFFNKHRKVDFSDLFIVNGKTQMRRNCHKDIPVLQYALTSNNILDYHRMLTHISCIKYFARLKLIIMVCMFGKKKDVPMGYILDYILWREFFSIYKGDQIWVYGHYDRLTTQIALLSVQFRKKFNMRQHGLLEYNRKLPHKISANRVIAFDENEAKKFKNEVILNSSCEYRVEYICSVDFQYTEKHGRRIGIIDAGIDEMVELIRLVEKFCFDFDAEYVLMLRPLSKIRDEFLGKKGIKLIEGKKKELNCDILFSGPSTLAYDYIRAGFNNPIVIYELRDSKVLAGLQETCQNVTICYTLGEFEENVKKWAKFLEENNDLSNF